MLKTIKNWLLPRLGLVIFELLLLTVRVEVKGEEKVKHILKTRQYIYASWHGRLILFFLKKRKNKGTAVMTSKSRDGNLAASMQETAGYKPFRGSTKKGGRDALEEIAEYMTEQKQAVLLSIDGPTGPIYKAKPGAIKLAEKTGYPIIPISFSAKRAAVFKSWDRCLIPKPFTKATLIYGEPIYLPSDATAEQKAELLQNLESDLVTITTEIDSAYGIKA